LSSPQAVFDLMEKHPAFAVLPSEGHTGAADWKLTGQGLGGSLVLAGAPKVPHREYLLSLLARLGSRTLWDALPLVLMRDGTAAVSDFIS